MNGHRVSVTIQISSKDQRGEQAVRSSGWATAETFATSATVTLRLRSDDHIGVVPLAVDMHAVLITVIMLNV
jgi:hypothetical protein